MKKVLIFDDDEDILSICRFILEEEGWQVQVYSNCEDVITKVSSFHPDVILMDNWIPPDGGIIATLSIKANPEFQAIPVIYFSANSDIQTLASTANADRYLSKPFELVDLKDIMAEALVNGK